MVPKWRDGSYLHATTLYAPRQQEDPSGPRLASADLIVCMRVLHLTNRVSFLHSLVSCPVKCG